jgi:hypothetical protein
MNGQNNPFQPTPPDFDKMVWKCPCCKQERTDKYIKVTAHDISQLFGSETGVMFINVKYCVDMPGCKEKAFNREWVINNFLGAFVKDANHKIDVPKP